MCPVSDEGRPVPLTDLGFRFCPVCGAPLPGPRPVQCSACGSTHWRNAKPCAGALVTDGSGALLLVQRAMDPWKGFWDIPGGFCESDELPEDAAIREVHEETGLTVRITGLVGMWIDRYGTGDAADTTLNCYYTATPVGDAVITVDPAESTAARWFAPDALPAEIAFPDHERDVLDAWRALTSPSS